MYAKQVRLAERKGVGKERHAFHRMCFALDENLTLEGTPSDLVNQAYPLTPAEIALM
jgi:hypothetical protein